MCGIVGYTGKNQACEVLLSTLSRLEYRGYDSVGISLWAQPIRTFKTKGRIADLRNRLEKIAPALLTGTCGIGHTRWATHGEPSDLNAHPHNAEHLSVVHNGIIENYQKLKLRLTEKGYPFVSETDSEVIARCLDEHYRIHHDPLQAIQETIQLLEGSYACGVLFDDQPETIYAFRKDSPLIVGLGTDEHFIASDISALLTYTKDYLLLEAGEIAVVKPDHVVILDAETRQEIHKDVQHAQWDVAAAEKGGYPHFMLKEIHEQPEAILKTMRPYLTGGSIDFSLADLSDDRLRKISKFHIVACGTAMHAGMVGKQLIETLARIPVEVSVASEFRYQQPILKADEAVMVISQSGETADTLAALRLAKDHDIRTLAICNVVGSSIAREARHVMITYGGPEIAVASTKAYSMQLTILYLLALKLAVLHQLMDVDTSTHHLETLRTVPDKMAEILSDEGPIQKLANTYQNADHLFYIGRQLDYALALEGSLKMKEISYIHCEAYPAGELKHGTISLITEKAVTIALATQSFVYDKMISNAQEVKARKGKLVLITQQSRPIDEHVFDAIIRIPDIDDLFAPLLSIVPLQLLAYTISVLRGNDVDKPRNLAKSVTVE